MEEELLVEADSWSLLTAASKRQQAAAIRSRLDAYIRLEEMDGPEDEPKAGYACPFCFEDFDIVGLCFHIDEEHPVEAKSGVCPLCPERIGLDLVGHIAAEHGSLSKMQRRRSHKGSSASRTMLSLLRKNLREGNLQSSFGGSSSTSAPNSAPDPLLSSFILNVPAIEHPKDEQPEFLDEECMIDKLPVEKVVESREPSASDEDQEERALKNEFVRGLVLSIIFEDTL